MLFGLGAVIAVVGLVGSASAKSELYFYSQTVSGTSSDSGFSTVDALYYGNHSNHGDRVIGSARLSCTFSSQDSALCNGKIELPSGTLLANHVIVAFSGDTTTVEINGGTGDFRGANGYVRSVQTSDSTDDFTVVLQ